MTTPRPIRPLADRVNPVDAVLEGASTRVRLAAASFLRYHSDELEQYDGIPHNGEEMVAVAERVFEGFTTEHDELLDELAAAYKQLNEQVDASEEEPALELLVALEMIESLLLVDQLR